MLEKSASYVGMFPQSSEALVGFPAKLRQALQRRVGKFGLVQIPPEQFDGVEFRGIAREPLHRQPVSHLPQRGRCQPASMSRKSIPQENDLSASMPTPRLQKANHLGAFDGACVQSHKPPTRPPLGSGQEGSDGREAFPIERFHQAGCFPFGRPGGPNGRLLRKPRLVEKTQPSPQASGFFLIWGKRWRTHRRRAASLRSRAFRAGRWRLHPNWPKSLQAWGTE